MIRSGSKSFSTAALLLPNRVREPAYALYAFCRLSDDLVDVDGGKIEAIDRLRTRLFLAYEGRPADSSVDRAFADAVARFAIPRALPNALLDGLEHDVIGVSCETLSDVYTYAACVAGAVGAMMTVLMGARTPNIVARACELGVAMQLTNIARDVGEDARNGRLYLPRSWLREVGVDPDRWLAAPEWNPEIGLVTAKLLKAAEKLYRRAESGIYGLPASCRSGIFVARHLYDAIGTEVAQNNFNAISVRARVPRARKLRLVGRALTDALRLKSTVSTEPALQEVQYLVDAVTALEPTRQSNDVRGPTESLLWVAELFVTLQARQSIRGVQG